MDIEQKNEEIINLLADQAALAILECRKDDANKLSIDLLRVMLDKNINNIPIIN
jgi:hypothetical protein